MAPALALLVAITCVPRIAVCESLVLSAGDRVRFIRLDGRTQEATVLSSTNDTIVVSYDFDTYPSTARQDAVWLGSLESLEVQLKPLHMGVGFIAGITLGALLGAAVSELALMSHTGEETFLQPWMIGAPVGALVGGVFGVAFAHDRGVRWKRITLSGG